MKKLLPKSHALIALAIVSTVAGTLNSRPILMQRPTLLSSVAVSAELTRMMCFGMVWLTRSTRYPLTNIQRTR
ncbi:hypothetical protein [Caballeronia sp. LZ034LL]|uniref:hypothetical protein n=1 Tax=Caballeronia sp. LZ034LL TaxID=3038567 RepID=UPI00285F4BFE|nr:hypothetical protein [Caballeronia sp. LZ034LL]MDR5837070.1 hypothetical protein [Caballeronia sp. LZ034LL]